MDLKTKGSSLEGHARYSAPQPPQLVHTFGNPCLGSSTNALAAAADPTETQLLRHRYRDLDQMVQPGRGSLCNESRYVNGASALAWIRTFLRGLGLL